MTDKEIVMKLIDLRLEKCLDSPSGDYVVVGFTGRSEPGKLTGEKKLPCTELELMTREAVIARIWHAPAENIRLVDITNGRPLIELKETE